MYKYILITILILLGACQQNKTGIAAGSSQLYTCSMDPQVLSDQPGKCPICSMELTPVSQSKSKPGEIQLSAQRIRLGNISSDTISNGRLSNSESLAATVTYDQEKINVVSARIMGRIEKLYYKNTGDTIKKGEPLYELYSEELNNAKQEYLLAIARQKEFGKESSIDLPTLTAAARNKLLLWGMGDVQIQQLQQSGKAGNTTTFYSAHAGIITAVKTAEGSYVMEGGQIMEIADLSEVWAEAQVYNSMLTKVRLDMPVSVMVPTLPGQQFRGRIDFISPEINPSSASNLVRVSIPNAAKLLQPGLPAQVVISNNSNSTLFLPIDAVLFDENKTLVWLRKSNHIFRRVEVRTGVQSDSKIEILSGLSEGDRVVTTGAYLLNSEYELRTGSK